MMDLMLRRRIMMANVIPPWVPSGDISEYISDGLTFHVDGIESAEGTVKDLVTDTIFNANTAASIAYENGGIVLTGGFFYRATALLGNSSSQTVEVCFSPSVMQACCIFASGTNGVNTYYPCVIFTANGEQITFLARKGSAYNPGLVANGKYTISMNTARGISNGVAMATNGTNYYANVGHTVIGARRYSNAYSAKFSGTIYSIRVYSRQLTQAEMLHNQKVDNVRFNLGLTI